MRWLSVGLIMHDEKPPCNRCGEHEKIRVCTGIATNIYPGSIITHPYICRECLLELLTELEIEIALCQNGKKL